MESVIHRLIALVSALLWLCIVLFLRLRKKKSFAYLALLTAFYVYLFKVLDYTLFQFQTLLLLKHFMPNLMLNGLAAGEEVNLVPLVTLTLAALKTSLLNILLMVPFGFGLPFVANLHMKRVVIFGALFSVAIELAQFLSGRAAGMTFRVADINDVIFNTTGVVVGYLLYVAFARMYRCL